MLTLAIFFSKTEKFCGRINGSSQLFASCSQQVDLEPYFTNCVFDVCATGGDAQVLESVRQLDICEIESIYLFIPWH